VEKHNPSLFILQYATQQMHDGHYDVALNLGFDWAEIRILESLSLQDFHWLKTLSASFIEFEVRINHAQTRLALQRLTEQQHAQALQTQLLVAGAPRHLMSHLYGWIPQQYRCQRKLLQLDDAFPNGGRPVNPTLNEEEAILSHWERLADLALPERYLQTALAVQVSVRQVCRALSLRDEREHEALTVAPTLARARGDTDRRPWHGPASSIPSPGHGLGLNRDRGAVSARHAVSSPAGSATGVVFSIPFWSV
jgi:hypothetical protein